MKHICLFYCYFIWEEVNQLLLTIIYIIIVFIILLLTFRLFKDKFKKYNKENIGLIVSASILIFIGDLSTVWFYTFLTIVLVLLIIFIVGIIRNRNSLS